MKMARILANLEAIELYSIASWGPINPISPVSSHYRENLLKGIELLFEDNDIDIVDIFSCQEFEEKLNIELAKKAIEGATSIERVILLRIYVCCLIEETAENGKKLLGISQRMLHPSLEKVEFLSALQKSNLYWEDRLDLINSSSN